MSASRGSGADTASVEEGGALAAPPRALPRPGLVQIFPAPGGAAPQYRSVVGEVTIGREATDGFRLPDARVSRRHAAVRRIDEGFMVRDLGSRHGTFVDGRGAAVDGTKACFGSLIRVGGCLLLVVEDVERYAKPAQRIKGKFLGVQRDVWAGPGSWNVWQQATRAASLAPPVLILGESGSGKEAIARLVHASRKEPGPFVALNLAAIPEGLFESELFGHARGAFTGAGTARLGAFREAQGGVLFLDEVGDLRLDLQAKLLRAIDQMRVRPLGASADHEVCTRIVAATSRDLMTASAAGSFRMDLFYRLSGIVLRVLPLRERREEILLIAQAMLEAAHPRLELSVQAAETLVLSAWPGNVRQLDNALTQASVATLSAQRTLIAREDLPDTGTPTAALTTAVTSSSLVAAVRAANGNASAAALSLGVSRAQLYKLLKRFRIEPATLRTLS